MNSRLLLQAKLEDLAVRDELTGLYNRRELNRFLHAEVNRAQRCQQVFGFILIDVDHFKSVNDTYGHQVGDLVLQWLAQEVRSGIRAIDLAARFGGEEIAVVLPNLGAADAVGVAERIRQGVASQPFIKGDVQFGVTLSAGVAVFTPDIQSEVELIASADQALYQAKHGGRNRTVIL